MAVNIWGLVRLLGDAAVTEEPLISTIGNSLGIHMELAHGPRGALRRHDAADSDDKFVHVAETRSKKTVNCSILIGECVLFYCT